MKRHPFNANEVDESRLLALTKKLGLTVTAVIREAIRLLHKKEITNVSKILCIAAVLLSLGSCVAFQAQGQNANGNGLFKGRYWFLSRGVGNMSEGGVITADGLGHFTLHSMYISDGTNNSINTAGVYSLTQAGAGTAKQGACLVQGFICNGGNDYEALFVSSDGSYGIMVSMEGAGAGWSLELHRDPDPYPYNLTNCDARLGTIQNCYDGFIMPIPWK